jgi:glycine cleavage system transcriptional repressor
VPQLALSAVGRDRPGIVAATTEVLLRHGVNVEDSRMSILRGHFTMMLILDVPEGTDGQRLSSDLEAVANELELEAVAVGPVEPLAERAPEPTHVLSIYGVDHPGIVHQATQALADHGVNITDLETRLADGEDGPPLYALLIEVVVPADADAPKLDEALSAMGERESVEVSLRELDRHEL